MNHRRLQKSPVSGHLPPHKRMDNYTDYRLQWTYLPFSSCTDSLQYLRYSKTERSAAGTCSHLYLQRSLPEDSGLHLPWIKCCWSHATGPHLLYICRLPCSGPVRHLPRPGYPGLLRLEYPDLLLPDYPDLPRFRNKRW